MISSSIVMGLTGVTASFFPKEILDSIGLTANELSVLFVQITGALYLGFAVMNWMAKTVLIGGIYSRPLCMGNFLHFTVAALALIKAATNNSNLKYVWVATIVYAIFAVLFGIILFTNPGKK